MDDKVSEEKAFVFQIPAAWQKCSGVCSVLRKVAKTRRFDKDACRRSCYFGRPLFWDCTMAKREHTVLVLQVGGALGAPLRLSGATAAIR